MYPHNLRAPTDVAKPEVVGICDRCGFLYPLSRLLWQFDQRGPQLANLHIRVCYDRCLDQPATFLKPIIIGPDPIPPKDPRPYNYAADAQGGIPAPTDIATFLEIL